MPSANLDLVRSLFAAWELGDYGSADWADPDIEYVIADGPEPGGGKGLAGLAEAWGSWLSAWEDLRVGVDEYRELDDERVLVLVRKSGRGKESGLEIGGMHARGASVFHVRGGKVTRTVLYYDRENALADLGLTREAGYSAVRSPELIERFKEGFEQWNCGDLDLMQDQYAEDAEFDFSAVFTDMEPLRGRESIRRQWDELWKAWEGIKQVPLEVFDLGRGRFVVEVRLWGKGKRSGVEVDQRFACLYTIRESDNKVVRNQLFPSVQAAMDHATASKSAARTA